MFIIVIILSFGAFSNEEVQKVADHTLECMSKESLDEQEENAKIYQQFMAAKEAGNTDMAHSAVEMLAENYKTMFALDNARNLLLDLAKEYLQGEKLAVVTDHQFGKGCSEYVAHAIQHYYGA